MVGIDFSKENTVYMPLVEIRKQIGDIGEKIAHNFFINNNLFIVAEKFKFLNNTVVDFIITSSVKKKRDFRLLHNKFVLKWFTIEELAPFLLESIKIPIISGLSALFDENDVRFYELKNKYSHMITKIIFNEESKQYEIYDLTGLMLNLEKIIREKYIVVEVKTTIKDNFLKLSGKGRTNKQKEKSYCDYFLRVKIVSDFSEQVIGIINDSDAEALLSDPRLKYRRRRVVAKSALDE